MPETNRQIPNRTGPTDTGNKALYRPGTPRLLTRTRRGVLGPGAALGQGTGGRNAVTGRDCTGRYTFLSLEPSRFSQHFAAQILALGSAQKGYVNLGISVSGRINMQLGQAKETRHQGRDNIHGLDAIEAHVTFGLKDHALAEQHGFIGYGILGEPPRQPRKQRQHQQQSQQDYGSDQQHHAPAGVIHHLRQAFDIPEIIELIDNESHHRHKSTPGLGQRRQRMHLAPLNGGLFPL